MPADLFEDDRPDFFEDDRPDPFADIPDQGPNGFDLKKGITVKKTDKTYAAVATAPVRRRAIDYVPQESGEDLTRMVDLEGVDLEIITITSKSTKYGEGVLIYCRDGDGDLHKVLTCAVALVDRLLDLAQKNADGEVEFPVFARFVKVTPNGGGNSYWNME